MYASEASAFLVQIFRGVVPKAPDDEKGGIDIVYELYGLTDEEIEIVEAAVGE